MTRAAFTSFGDSTDNAISFTGVYSPRMFARSFSPVDSVHNITDDVSVVWRAHTFQFGTNIQSTRSRQQTFLRSFDTAATNAAFYTEGGNSVTNPINAYLQNAFGYQIDGTNITNIQNAVTAVIGHLTGYTANFNFFRDGSLQPAGTPRKREFRTEEYGFYVQDIWKLSRNLTITAGLRYELSRPVYETSGYEVKPNISLSEYFERRAVGAGIGTPYNQPIVLDLSGAVNGKSSLYKWDKNNFQPRFAVAWSPNFGKTKRNLFDWLFGANNESVIRGGFAVTNDHLAPLLIIRYGNAQGSAGFASSPQVRNVYNLTDTIAPPFTGFDQTVRNLRNLQLPNGNLIFPFQAPNRISPTTVELGFDENLISPINYNWNLTYERALPAGLIVSVSYLGRKARNLLQARDAAAIADFFDTQSGTDWFTAATQLEVLRQQGAPVSQIQQIPYFANLFPANLSALLTCPAGYNQTQAVYSLVFTGAGGCGAGIDWTNVQSRLSRLSSRFPGNIFFISRNTALTRLGVRLENPIIKA